MIRGNPRSPIKALAASDQIEANINNESSLSSSQSCSSHVSQSLYYIRRHGTDNRVELIEAIDEAEIEHESRSSGSGQAN